MHPPRAAGVVLAGGRSRRMGGVVKALLPLAGKPMIQHVIERVRPQVSELMLSVEEPDRAFEFLKLEQVPDRVPGSRGPLGGLFSALVSMDSRYDWLLLVPCDAPFVPGDLFEKLFYQALESNRPGAVASVASEIQPTFSIWHRSLLPDLEHAVLREDMAGFKQFLDGVKLAVVDWPLMDSSAFFNINDQEALNEADRLMQTVNRTPGSCSA